MQHYYLIITHNNTQKMGTKTSSISKQVFPKIQQNGKKKITQLFI